MTLSRKVWTFTGSAAMSLNRADPAFHPPEKTVHLRCKTCNSIPQTTPWRLASKLTQRQDGFKVRMILCQGCELSVTVEVTIARLTVVGSEIVPRIVRHHLPSVVVQVGKAVVAMGAKAATLGESVN